MDKLIIKNGVYSSMQKEYLYGDIARVKIKQSNNIYMQVFTKKDEEKVKRYCIDVVAPKDYRELVEMIKAKGIAVETEGLEAYLSWKEFVVWSYFVNHFGKRRCLGLPEKYLPGNLVFYQNLILPFS